VQKELDVCKSLEISGPLRIPEISRASEELRSPEISSQKNEISRDLRRTLEISGEL
jgi:hypothetical protein